MLTGWLLAMSRPGRRGGRAPSALIAIGITKRTTAASANIFNRRWSRVALLVSFPVVMTTWVAPPALFSPARPASADGLAITLGAGVPDR